MITSNGWCKHKDGGRPSGCEVYTAVSLDSMKSYCTNHPSCIGFTFQASDDYGFLYVSDDSCPSAFPYVSRDGWKVAETIDDLVAEETEEFVCYGKIIGKSILESQQYF